MPRVLVQADKLLTIRTQRQAVKGKREMIIFKSFANRLRLIPGHPDFETGVIQTPVNSIFPVGATGMQRAPRSGT